ncbi:hypothetical protein QBC46DRAFT_434005 [Diplogelasinospora grovesii]|uniref:Uncharacterized protein n=1 Tax=Diplogelasinospora grovesii TaxID=303347 RepID=A0AAN6S509_9PEZI|nr:hypothetical protein QBC46DRAFT_434005 [Diplogelasinospora grovesii]
MASSSLAGACGSKPGSVPGSEPAIQDDSEQAPSMKLSSPSITPDPIQEGSPPPLADDSEQPPHSMNPPVAEPEDMIIQSSSSTPAIQEDPDEPSKNKAEDDALTKEVSDAISRIATMAIEFLGLDSGATRRDDITALMAAIDSRMACIVPDHHHATSTREGEGEGQGEGDGFTTPLEARYRNTYPPLPYPTLSERTFHYPDVEIGGGGVDRDDDDDDDDVDNASVAATAGSQSPLKLDQGWGRGEGKKGSDEGGGDGEEEGGNEDLEAVSVIATSGSVSDGTEDNGNGGGVVRGKGKGSVAVAVTDTRRFYLDPEDKSYL